MNVRGSGPLASTALVLALAGGALAHASGPAATSSVAWVAPGQAPSLVWPSLGQAAVAVAGVGLVGSSPTERPVPIASVTKMMTALVVLHDHPLLPGQSGPLLPIGQEDVADWKREVRAGDSVVEVRAGEALTEYQALEALLISSADNIADRLAVWDAGSAGAFVARMNAFARALGLASTHYEDPSGLDPRSASIAADQARVASELMRSPVARSIVRRTRINLPVVGILPNRNPALAVDGIVGVKGGFTSHAHTCLVTAAFRLRHGALVISVALGQPDPLTAAHVDEALLQAATAALREHVLFSTADPRSAGWGFRLRSTGAGHGRSLAVAVWPGLTIDETIKTFDSAKKAAAPPARVVVRTPWSVEGPFLVRRLPTSP